MSKTGQTSIGKQHSKAPREMWSIPSHSGEDYIAVMERFHRFLKPDAYLEIGVAKGTSLKIAKCASIAIDPYLKIAEPVFEGKSVCMFYQMPSDQFFRNYDPKVILGRPIDIAFLDGMHWFEYLLRDFINVEKNCRNNSVMMLHDCIPTDEYIGRRRSDDASLEPLSAFKNWWAGDVWKVVAILLKYRPDLRVMALDAKPTGLVCVTNLDPNSDVLSKGYFDIVSEYRELTLTAHGNKYMEDLKITSTKDLATAEALGASFWL